jgi:hypothetical protein
MIIRDCARPSNRLFADGSWRSSLENSHWEDMTDTSKPQRSRRRPSPDTLIQPGKKGDIELKEEELKRVTGGSITIAIASGSLCSSSAPGSLC